MGVEGVSIPLVGQVVPAGAHRARRTLENGLGRNGEILARRLVVLRLRGLPDIRRPHVVMGAVEGLRLGIRVDTHGHSRGGHARTAENRGRRNREAVELGVLLRFLVEGNDGCGRARGGVLVGARGGDALRGGPASLLGVEQDGGTIVLGQLVLLIAVVLVACGDATLPRLAALEVAGTRLQMTRAHLAHRTRQVKADDDDSGDAQAHEDEKAGGLPEQREQHPGQAVADIPAPAAQRLQGEETRGVGDAVRRGDAERPHHGDGKQEHPDDDAPGHEPDAFGEDGDGPGDEGDRHQDGAHAEQGMEEGVEGGGHHAGAGDDKRHEQRGADHGNDDAGELAAGVKVEKRGTRRSRARRHARRSGRAGLRARGAGSGRGLLGAGLLGPGAALTAVFGCLLRACLALGTTHAP